MKKRLFAVVLSIMFVLCCFTGCAPESEGGGDDKDVNLSETSKTIKINESFELTADRNDVVWVSSDSNVVSVKNGLVTGLKEGNATVSAVAGDKSASCNVTVRNTYYPVLKIVNKTNSLFLGCDYDMSAALSVGGNAVTAPLSWSSSNTEVATVDAEGKVSALAKGKTVLNVTATYDGILLSDSVEVFVKDLSYIEAPQTIEMGLYAGDRTCEVDYTVYISAEPTENTAEISVGDESVVSEADGVLTALKEGETAVTLTYRSDTDFLTAVIPVKVERHIVHTFSEENENVYAGDVNAMGGSLSGSHWTKEKTALVDNLDGRTGTRVRVWAYYWSPALGFDLELSKADLERYAALGYTKLVVPFYNVSEYSANIRVAIGGTQTELLTNDGWKDLEFPLSEFIANYDTYAVSGAPIIRLANCWATSPDNVNGKEVGWYVYFGDLYLK